MPYESEPLPRQEKRMLARMRVHILVDWKKRSNIIKKEIEKYGQLRFS